MTKFEYDVAPRTLYTSWKFRFCTAIFAKVTGTQLKHDKQVVAGPIFSRHWIPYLYFRTSLDIIGCQCSGLSWKSCRSWSEFWEIQTLICKEMCKKFLVLTKSCRSRTDGPALVSNTVGCSCCLDFSGHVRRPGLLPKLTQLLTSAISASIQLYARGSK